MKIYNLIFSPYSESPCCPHNSFIAAFSLPSIRVAFCFGVSLFSFNLYIYFFFNDIDLLGDPAQLFCKICVRFLMTKFRSGFSGRFVSFSLVI